MASDTPKPQAGGVKKLREQYEQRAAHGGPQPGSSQQQEGSPESPDSSFSSHEENDSRLQNSVPGYNYVMMHIVFLLKEHGDFTLDDSSAVLYPPELLCELLQDLLEEMSSEIQKFNVTLQDISGHEIGKKVTDHSRKVLEVIADYEKQLRDVSKENFHFRTHIAHLEAELAAAQIKLDHIASGSTLHGGFEDTILQEDFMTDLEARVAHGNSLTSSFIEEIENERQNNADLVRELNLYKRYYAERETVCMNELSKLTHQEELKDQMTSTVIRMIKGWNQPKSPNQETMDKIVNNWKAFIDKAMLDNGRWIEERLKHIEEQKAQMSKLESESTQRYDEMRKLTIEQEKYLKTNARLVQYLEEIKAANNELRRIIILYQEDKRQKSRQLREERTSFAYHRERSEPSSLEVEGPALPYERHEQNLSPIRERSPLNEWDYGDYPIPSFYSPPAEGFEHVQRREPDPGEETPESVYKPPTLPQPEVEPETPEPPKPENRPRPGVPFRKWKTDQWKAKKAHDDWASRRQQKEGKD